jgi:hypothetical protein
VRRLLERIEVEEPHTSLARTSMACQKRLSFLAVNLEVPARSPDAKTTEQ